MKSKLLRVVAVGVTAAGLTLGTFEAAASAHPGENHHHPHHHHHCTHRDHHNHCTHWD